MALATRPKPKVHHRKARAQHHRQTKPYLKTYWPYIPMVGIVALGAYVSQNWPSGLVKLDASGGPTRIEALAGNQNAWALAFIVIMAGLAAGTFIFQNWFRIQRTLNRGERFMVKHPWFDILLVAIATLGVVLTRSNLGY